MKFYGLLQTSIALITAAVYGGIVGIASGQTSISVLDSSFEYPVTSSWQDNTGLAAGSVIPDTSNAWYYLGGFIQTGSPVGVQFAAANGMNGAAEGSQSGYLNNGSWIASTNLAVIQSNTTYSLTLSESDRTGFPQTAGFTLALAYGSTPGPDLTNQLLAVQYVSLATVTNNAAAGDWFTYSVSATTGLTDPAIGQSLFILIGSEANPGSFAQQVNVDDIHLTAEPAPTNDPTGFLPAGWSDQDVGAPALAGSASYTNGVWSLSGGGTGIGGTGDQFHLAATTLSGDGMLIARVTGQTSSDPGAQAGVMIRNDAASNAPEASVLVTPGAGIAFCARPASGATTSQTTVQGVAVPAWVRLSRSANTFTAAYSIDGISWTQIGSPETISMGSPALAGLAVSGHNPAALGAATLRGVLVVPGPQTGVPVSLINPYTQGIPFAGETTWPLPQLTVASNAPTPRMGWNSWFTVGDNPGPSEALIKSIADAMATNGLASAGYDYVVIDCSWLASGRGSRAANGQLIVDPTRWPSGMKALADYVHSKGLLMGGYTDIGSLGYGSPAQIGSFGYYQQDADQFAAWGWDFVKIDDHGPGDFYAAAYAMTHNSIGRPIVVSFSTPQVDRLQFASRLANSFRVNNDISFTFGSVSWGGILTEFDTAEADWYAQAPGHWLDPDMLCTGMNGITDLEGRSHFNMWAILGAPLMLGTDVRSAGASPASLAPPLSAATLATLTNAEVVAVDQDPLGAVGRPVAPNIYAKPLGSFTSGRYAVLLLNRSSQPAGFTVNWGDVGLVPGSTASVRDLWAHQDLGTFAGSYISPAIPSHGSMMLEVAGSFDWNRPRTYEAEWGYNTLTGTAYFVPHNPNFSSSAYVTGVGMGAANTLQFNQVAAPSNGLYEIDIYYACSGSRTAQMSANGGAATNLSFAATGGDTNSVGVQTAYVSLLAGTNTLAFSNSTGPAPNFDKIIVSRGTPSGLQAVAGDGSVSLSWIGPAADATFNVYRGTGSGTETLLTNGLAATNYTDTAVTNGTTYYYFVTAMNPTLGGESPPSTEVSARPRYATTSFAFPSIVLSNAPVAYWRLNETNGSPTAMDSAGGFNGTYGSAVTPGVAGPQPPDFLGFEVTNTAAQFANGVNQSWITIPALNLNSDTVTFTAWIYPFGSQAPYTGLLFCRSGSTVAGMNYNGAGTDLGYTWNNDQGSWGWNSGVGPPALQWSFVAVVVQPHNTVVYLINTNGLQSATNFLNQANQAFAGAGTIGTDTYSSVARVFNGVMDEVAVFNYALTPSQIGQLYDNGHELPQVQIGLQQTGAGLNLSWPQGTLFQATNIAGPWFALTNATSSFDVTPTNAAAFFRVLLR